MKKYILLLLAICMVGCAKEETKEAKLCNNLDAYVAKYEKKEVTFEELSLQTETLFNEYCTEKNDTCITLKSIKEHANYKYEKQDCSKITKKELKDLCELTNKSVQNLYEEKDDINEAHIIELKRNCEFAREK